MPDKDKSVVVYLHPVCSHAYEGHEGLCLELSVSCFDNSMDIITHSRHKVFQWLLVHLPLLVEQAGPILVHSKP